MIGIKYHESFSYICVSFVWNFSFAKMLLFGLVLVLFYIRSSSSSQFCKSLQTTDKTLHKVAVLYQKSLRKLEKAKLDIKFLNKCKDTKFFSKFLRWCNVKRKPLHIKNNLNPKNFNNAIKEIMALEIYQQSMTPIK